MKGDDRINLLTQYLAGIGADRIVLFGSRSRGDHSPCSDIDLAVSFAAPVSFREKRKIKEKTEELSGLYSLDLIFMDEANEGLRLQIEKEGRVLYEKDRTTSQDRTA